MPSELKSLSSRKAHASTWINFALEYYSIKVLLFKGKSKTRNIFMQYLKDHNLFQYGIF